MLVYWSRWLLCVYVCLPLCLAVFVFSHVLNTCCPPIGFISALMIYRTVPDQNPLPLWGILYLIQLPFNCAQSCEQFLQVNRSKCENQVLVLTSVVFLCISHVPHFYCLRVGSMNIDDQLPTSHSLFTLFGTFQMAISLVNRVMCVRYYINRTQISPSARTVGFGP